MHRKGLLDMVTDFFDCSHLHTPGPNGHAGCPSCNSHPHRDPFPIVHSDIDAKSNRYRIAYRDSNTSPASLPGAGS